MIWLNTWGFEEKLFLVCFLLAYIVYITRLWYLARNYKLNVGNTLKKIIIRSLYFALIFIAILGPSFGDSKKEIAVTGKDIYLVVDVSLSMNATDIAPSRLAMAKQCALEVVKKKSVNDRIGIIIFGDNAYQICPLTYDHSALDIYINSIQTLDVANHGSDINEVLALLNDKNTERKKVDKEKKIALLITDGEFSEPASIKNLDKFSKEYICYGIAVGTAKGAKIAYNGNYKKNKTGQIVISKTNLAALADITIATGGSAKLVTDAKVSAEQFIYETNRKNQYFRGYKKRDVSSNKYYYILTLAAVLIIIDGLTSLKIIHV